MFRNLNMMRKVLLSPVFYARYSSRFGISTTNKFQAPAKKPGMPTGIPGVHAHDINFEEMAREDEEFARNFGAAMSSLAQVPQPELELPTDNAPPNPPVANVDEATTGTAGGCGSSSSNTGAGDDAIHKPPAVSSVLDKDGMPIVPIDIDGWKDFQDEDDLPKKGDNKHIDIGDDEEYNAMQALMVPETREGRFAYKGIKVELPSRMHKDKGTYRYRRNAEELATVADDMRVVRFDTK